MISQYKNITIEVLLSYIENHDDVNVRDSVERWLSSDPNNRNIFNKLKKIWEEKDDLKELNKDNIEKDWCTIMDLIDNKNESNINNKGESKREIHYLLRVVAVVILLISISLGYYMGSKDKPVSSSLITYNEIIVPKGQRSELVLGDGTRIWINAESKLRFPNQFPDDLREVWLEGEAYFEVTKNESKPFFVRTSDLNIKVYGTDFNVRAYPDEDIMETTLVEGSVSIIKNATDDHNIQEIFLKPNQRAVYAKKDTSLATFENSKEIEIPVENKQLLTQPVQIEPIISWTEGKLIFNNEPFESLIVKLQRMYNVDIIVKNDEIKKIHYTGVLNDISLEQALEAIRLTTDIIYSIKGNTVTINSKNNPDLTNN